MNPDEKIRLVPTYVPTQLPVFICSLGLIRDQLVLARQAIDELRISHPDSPQSNVSAVYMSPWNSHFLNPKLLPLCESVVTIAHEAARAYMSANLAVMNYDLIVGDCWGVIYEQADSTRQHNHFPADFGAVVYLEADENSAPIIFSSNVAVQPKSESMVLFPGIMNHEVPPNNGRRVAVAMNLYKRAAFEKVLGAGTPG